MNEDSLLIDALLRVMRDLRSRFDDAAHDVGLTFARARVLSTLARMEGATQSDLAEALGIEAPTLKRQLDALEENGFVERRAHDGDRRKRGLFLTDRAREAHTTHFVEHIRADLTRGVSDEDKRQARAVLQRLADNAEALGRK